MLTALLLGTILSSVISIPDQRSSSTATRLSTESLLTRVKRQNRGGICAPGSNAQRKAIEEVIAMWDADTVYQAQSKSNLFANAGARIDLQKPYTTPDGKRIQVYNVQSGTNTFAAVQLQTNVSFGRNLIQTGFHMSCGSGAHVLFTEPNVNMWNNLPNRGEGYGYKAIRSASNGQTVWVWGLKDVINQF